ncbi:MAG TPA: glycosyltransferase family 2 protein [Patescibacteria group bacterium]|nr:glycosyltransferase family 2 protein [Patescibacteria group bacterium]
MTIHSERIYEIIPGALVWAILILSVVLSFIRPIWMIYFIILFDLYWMLRILYLVPFTLISWWRYWRAIHHDWQKDAERAKNYDQIYHAIFLPFSRETKEVALETLRVLSTTTYPAKRMIVILAGEARYLANAEQVIAAAKEKFGDVFYQFFTTIHPENLPDEIRGKGSNLNWSARQVVPKILALGLKPEQVIVSSFDIDTLVHPQYFSCLTHTFLTIPDPTRSSYQPVPLYNNNLWESPAPVRVAMFGTTFWLLTELARSEGMMTFASHSMSLKMLIDVGFWPKDMVSEDSRIFLKGLTFYHGEYRVTPIHLPVSMDTVMSGNYWKALIALYKQLQRWAWGIENFPYMVKAFVHDKKFPFWAKVRWLFKQLEGSVTWATAPLLIFILGYLPFWVAPEQFRSFALFQNTPFTLEWLMRFSMIGLFLSAGLALTLLPPRPEHLSRPQAYAIMLLQWILLPVTFIVFGAIPAIDAQTRLMLGKKLGFNISPKRKTN